MNKKGKVLLVANVAKEHVLKFHVPTIKKLHDLDWQIDVACSGEEEIPYCSNQYSLSYKRSPFNFALIKGVLELKKIIDTNSYDIIYCHTPVGGVAARLAAFSARKKGTKVIYFAHGYHFYKGAPKINWIVYYTMEKILSKITDTIILINEEDYLLTNNRFSYCKAYLVNGIGVDLSRFQVENPIKIKAEYRSIMDIPQDAIVLIYLAELLKNKNQTLLLDTLQEIHKKYQNVYLVLAGIDHCNGEMKEYAQKLGVMDYVRFLGWRNDVGNLYAMADICTASSIREGFGLNLVEAMSCLIPIIASLNRGHQTIIKDSVNGYLIPLGDSKLFAEKICTLIENNAIKEQFVNYNNKQIDKYSSERIVDELISIFYDHIS